MFSFTDVAFILFLPALAHRICSFVPESILKKRKAREELKKKAGEARKVEKVAAKKRREGMFKRAEQYVKDYAAVEKATIEAKRAARAKGDFFGE